MAPTIEFWYEFGSNYSYLSVMRIEDVASARSVDVVWRPFLLGPIFKTFGWDTSPFVLQKEKGAYMWKDMVRQCQKYGVPWRRPSVFPRMTVLPARIALLASEEPWIGEFSKRVMLMNFAEDREVNTAEAMRDVLTDLGLDAAEILTRANAEENKRRLRDQTEHAKSLGIFGAPTFFVRDRMYWGNDRLDDALEDAASVEE